jgi:uncharacterized protein YndB with AHSA1/START domain
MSKIAVNPELDLVLERIVDVPRALMWKAWTTPEHLMKWFCPRPWMTVECEIDLRPGGRFFTVMQSPEGEKYPNVGCYLEIIEQEKLVWTDALIEGFRPVAGGTMSETGGGFMTAVLEFEDHEGGTKYTATALHKSVADVKKHEAMGFHDGWGTVLGQLVEYIKEGHIK